MSNKEKKRTPSIIHPLGEEPWVTLDNADDMKSWEHADEVEYNQNNRQIEKYKFFVKTFDMLNDNEIKGGYHEFGCHRARTFRMALTEAHRHNMQEMNFFAYDSFEGLPETSTPTKSLWHTPGVLTTTEEDFLAHIQKHGIYTDRVRTIKGFYDDSLTDDLQTSLLDAGEVVALATVDCDLYESAVPVFKFLEPLIQEGTVIYLDDLFCGYNNIPTKGIGRAFLEFQQYSKFKFLRHMDVGWW